MGIGPIAAIPKALAQAGLTKEDVDVFEVGKCSLQSTKHVALTIHFIDQ
jgi:acetyl-CoA acetyltransferase